MSSEFHLSWRSARGAVLFPEARDQLAGVAAIARVEGGVPLWFCIADNHLHVVLAPVGSPNLYVRNLGFALSAIRPTLKLGSPHLETVDGMRHLERLAEYVPRNAEHHDIRGPWAAAPGNCVADLLGVRRLPGFDAKAWQRHLPRWELPEWLDAAGVPSEVMGRATHDQLREAGAWELARCAAAIVGRADPSGRSAAITRARRAVAKVASEVGIPRSELAAALGVRVDSTYDMAAHPSADDLADVLARRVHFEHVVRTVPMLPRKKDRIGT